MSFDPAEETPADAITIKEFEDLTVLIVNQRKAKDDHALEGKKIQAKLDELENQMLALMIKAKRTDWPSPLGTVYKQVIDSVKNPETKEDREAFYNFLRSRDLFDSMLSVNSNTLKSFYKSEKEAAAEKAKATGDLSIIMNFSIPGISAPTRVEKIGFRKK